MRINDNSPTPKSDFSAISKLTEKIADKTLAQLEKEGVFVFPETLGGAEDLTGDQTVLRSVDGAYRTGNVMGFLGCGGERLTIGSRFDGSDSDYFFRYLLEKALRLPTLVDLPTGAGPGQSIDLLPFLFPFYLRAAMRKGLFKQYVRRRYNDDRVRGTIDVARHIDRNTPFVGKVAYSRREFSFDNDLTELVRHTAEYIRGKGYGSRLLRGVRDEMRLVVDATPAYKLQDRQKIVERNRKSPVVHAYYREYLALQRLCIRILRHRRLQPGEGEQRVYGVLFDGAWLWEEYVNTLIGKCFYHPRNKGRDGVQQLFTGDRKEGRIYPDFISRDASGRIIADAKYKPAENIGGADYLQVLAYMFRFDAKRGFYLYPCSKDEKPEKLSLNQGTSYENNVARRPDEITITKLGLRIPKNGTSYEDFVGKMKEAEDTFQKNIFK